MNVPADILSKVFDKDDWRLATWVFNALTRLWGPFGVDRFSSDLNCLCSAFNSQDWCLGTAGVNAFAQSDWLAHLNWCNPPFWMIGRLIRFLQQTGAEAVVVVPLWQRSVWWPLVCPDGVHFAPFVTDARELPISDSLFTSGYHSGNTLPCKVPGYRFFALRISPSRAMTKLFCAASYECSCSGILPQMLRRTRWVRE